MSEMLVLGLRSPHSTGSSNWGRSAPTVAYTVFWDQIYSWQFSQFCNAEGHSIWLAYWLHLQDGTVDALSHSLEAGAIVVASECRSCCRVD
jgi:hypothetical protein